MADLAPKKINLADINNGKQYENGDGIQANAINDPIQASAYAQALATNQPDDSEAYLVGTPSVEIVEKADGTPQFKFKNLKGFTGAKLVNRVLQGQDQNGGNIYLDTFDDGTTVYFTAPKGPIPTLQDWMGTEQIGSQLHPLYYDGEKFTYAPYAPREFTLENATWEQIKAIADDGKGEEYFYVGEEKTVVLTTGEEVSFVILGFNHDYNADRTGRNAITFGMRNLLKDTILVAYTGPINYLYYEYSNIHDYILIEYLQRLPSELQSIITITNKARTIWKDFSISTIGSTTNELYKQKLFLFSPHEIDSTLGGGNDSLGTLYDYYKTVGQRVKLLDNGRGKASAWYTRAMSDGKQRVFDSTGGYEYATSNSSKPYGICFGFCI